MDIEDLSLYPIVEVFWLDAGMEETQLDKENALDLSLMPRKNAGYLLQNRDDKVILCFGVIKDNDHQGKEILNKILVIPRSIIVKLRRLK